ncbi:lysozyme [Hoylesella loescheii]|uniref:lysozyme n=1 Tax=Hoylesella loescheii TaxID=840 RepID=UPI00039EBEAE|nr:glycoside hydrolase family protein [Hoylesella loescheii]
MRTINSFILLCVFCLFCQPTLAQRRVRLADLPPFERAVVVVKYFEGLHGWKNYPYVGYGHQLQRGEYFTADMTERQADSLLRADLMKHIEIFKKYGKDALLLAVLSYNIGVGRILGYGKHPKSQLLRKIEAGDRNFYKEFVAFCRYKGKVLRGLLRRRQVEYTLFCLP